MTRREKQLEFLRELMQSHDCPQSRQLQEQLAKVQHDQACVRSAAILSIGLGLAASLGLGYSAVLAPEFSHQNTVVWIFSILLVASGISLLGFIGFGLYCRAACDEVFEECRRLICGYHRSEPQSAREIRRASTIEPQTLGVAEGQLATVPVSAQAVS
jgi:hypothetical protein